MRAPTLIIALGRDFIDDIIAIFPLIILPIITTPPPISVSYFTYFYGKMQEISRNFPHFNFLC